MEYNFILRNLCDPIEKIYLHFFFKRVWNTTRFLHVDFFIEKKVVRGRVVGARKTDIDPIIWQK